jgi:TDG/mug DNA glycosylase family protein
MQLKHPFDPIVDKHSKVLILGSFPSIKSFEENFYYAHPRNQFWPIMEALFDVTLKNNADKKAFALKHGIALYDTYGSLSRSQNNSSDSNLSDLQPNDIPALLEKFPQIKKIFCTGRKSYEGMKKSFPDLSVSAELLPSTSPAYAAMTFDQKLAAYQVVRDFLSEESAGS